MPHFADMHSSTFCIPEHARVPYRPSMPSPPPSLFCRAQGAPVNGRELVAPQVLVWSDSYQGPLAVVWSLARSRARMLPQKYASLSCHWSGTYLKRPHDVVQSSDSGFSVIVGPISGLKLYLSHAEENRMSTAAI